MASPQRALNIVRLLMYAILTLATPTFGQEGDATGDQVAVASEFQSSRTNAELISELVAELRDRANSRNQLSVRIRDVYQGGTSAMMLMDIYDFDYEELEALEKRVRNVSRVDFLRAFFKAVTSNVGEDHESRWYAVMNYFQLGMRHPTVGQPMYRDRTMVTDPLLLMLLGEGRCGHVARVVVDLALANGYEARLVGLATHVVAEVRWGNAWRWIDVNADFPVDSLRKTFGTLPSTYELSMRPYDLDRLPARAWRWSVDNLRTMDGQLMAFPSWYSGVLLTSSMYFGDQIFGNKFSGDPDNPRDTIDYFYKQGTPQDWEADRYWGWNTLVAESQVVDAVPLEYAVQVPRISYPSIVYGNNGRVEIPIRFWPASRPQCDVTQVFDCVLDGSRFTYEVRVSSKSRGWDYGFRNYDFMPGFGIGDLAVIRDVIEYSDGALGVDIQLEYEGDIFIEVIAYHEELADRGTYAWPSGEAYVRVIAPSMEPWNYGRPKQTESAF